PQISTPSLHDALPICRNQWAGQCMSFHAVDTTVQVHTGDNIAPLIAATDLQGAVVLTLQLHEVISLQQHVGKFGVGNTVGFQATDRKSTRLNSSHVSI